MKKVQFYGICLVSIIISGIPIIGCESDQDNWFGFHILFDKDTVTYYRDDIQINDYPLIRGSLLPHTKVFATAYYNSIRTKFKHPSATQVFLGWLMYDPMDDRWQCRFTAVGQQDSFSVQTSGNVKLFFFTMESIGDTCHDTVNVTINSEDSLSLIPSQCHIKPLTKEYNLDAIGIPVSADYLFGTNNFSGDWIFIVNELKPDTYDIDFTRPNGSFSTFGSGPVSGNWRFRFFGLKL